MSEIKECDEQEALKLDEHFKQTLIRVRSYILNLKSVKEAYLCKIWLDKLNSAIMQRNLRNEYLLELFCQLRTGTLEGIFKTQPPHDSLIPLPSSCRTICVSTSLSELSDYGKSYHNSLTSSRRSDQTYLRNRMKLYTNSMYTTSYAQCQNENIKEKNRLKFCGHHINILTDTLENLQIRNERFKQELRKCQGKKRDNEVHLRNHIKRLTTRTQNQNLEWKVRTLKNTVARLKKLNNCREYAYWKKLQHIIRDMNLKIKTMQLQFQRQMSELCLSLCLEKQNELCSLVESLEERYKMLLATADATIENQRQEYFTKIVTLENELYHLRNSLQSNPEYM